MRCTAPLRSAEGGDAGGRWWVLGTALLSGRQSDLASLTRYACTQLASGPLAAANPRPKACCFYVWLGDATRRLACRATAKAFMQACRGAGKVQF